MAINHVGPYQVVREIGEGGFAKVYECKAPDGRQVAVKLRQYGEEKRFRKEANLMLSMRHRGVVRVLDSGRDEETVQLYTVMEYIPYPTLATILAHEGKLPEHTTVTILKRIAEALDYVYRHSDVAAHRDIKPGNIFVKLNGDRVEEVKVTDFGIYRTTQGMGTFAAMGDPEYNPPEQIQNAGNYSAATDVYSLGCLGFRMLTGRPPFVGDPLSLASAHIHDPPPPLKALAPELDPCICSVIGRCLEKEPSERFVSMRQLFAALSGGNSSETANNSGGHLDDGGRNVRTRPVPMQDGVAGNQDNASPSIGSILLIAGIGLELFLLVIVVGGIAIGLLGLQDENQVLLWTGGIAVALGIIFALLVPALLILLWSVSDGGE